MKNTGEEKKLIRTEVRTVEGVRYTYELKSRKQRLMASFGIPLYSIGVKMCFTDTGRTSENETADIFADFNKATGFFDRIVEGLITPIDLTYVVEDELT